MSKWILFVLALGLPFFGQAEPKVEQKSKTTLAIGKAVGEFSWSETDETGQSLMLSPEQKLAKHKKRLEKQKRESSYKRSRSSHSKRSGHPDSKKVSRKDYIKLSKKIKSVERTIDRINKSLITGLTVNNDRVYQLEQQQHSLTTKIFELSDTYGAIDNQLENFNDYSLYGSEDMFGEESPVKIGDILPVDSGVDVNSEEDMFYSDNYRQRRFTPDDVVMIDRHFSFKKIDCTQSQVTLVISENLQKRFSRLMIQLHVPVKPGTNPSVQLLEQQFLKATADSTYPQATYVTTSMHTTLQLYVSPGDFECIDEIRLTVTAL